MSIETCYDVLTIGSLAVLVLLALVCLVRCILGPRISDRVMAVNMIGTLTIIMVVVFVVHLGEAYLADIALIYAMISFLSVVVLCKVYTGIYRERQARAGAARREERQPGGNAGSGAKRRVSGSERDSVCFDGGVHAGRPVRLLRRRVRRV